MGRRSAARYDTPIDAQRTATGIAIPHVRGADADWCRNILAGGGCTLTLADGSNLVLSSPEVISVEAAEARLDAGRTKSGEVLE